MMTETLTPEQQIDRIETLLQSTKNPKKIRQYKALIRGLQAQLKPLESDQTVTPVDEVIVVPEPQQQPKVSQKEELEPIQTPQTETLFSAVGVIQGEVIVSEDNKYEIKIGDKKYNLGFTSKHLRHNFDLEMSNSESTENHLLVYPKIIHFPDKNKPYIVGFQIRGWKDKPYEKFNPNEFNLCGLWQFIPVCRGPVISIHKNKTSDRIEWLKNKDIELEKKVRFLKASHIPLIWKDAPVKPFRFNPKTKTQGDRYFVQVKARFLPGRDCWGFIETIEPPTKDYPKFLKPRKEDKAAVLAAKAKGKRS